MNPLPKAALTFVGVTLGYAVLTCFAWVVTAYLFGDKTLQGAFLVSPSLSFLFLPMFVGCVFAGYVRGKSVYRRASGSDGSPALGSDSRKDTRLKRAWFVLQLVALIGSVVVLWSVGASWIYITMVTAAAVFVVFRYGTVHG
jgi:hypothetical protein